MQSNIIHSDNLINVKIADDNGHQLYDHTASGFRNVEQAIASAYAAMKGEDISSSMRADQSLEEKPSFFHYYANPDSPDNEIENYVFTVTNESLHTSARYRVNAGGHVRILPEMRP